MYNLILASSSRRQIVLLESIGYKPDKIVSVCINEEPRQKELPRKLVERLALEKVGHIREKFPSCLILGTATMVARGRRMFPKPRDKTEACNYLKSLSGRRHTVYTAVCVMKAHESFTKVVETKLKFKLLTNQEINVILESNEWKEMHGGYDLQGVAGAYISWINGHVSNVIGLPVHETYKILSGAIGLKQAVGNV